MKESYPYTIIPQTAEKIRKEGIPLPKLPKLPPVPQKVKRKVLGTILFIVSLSAFITLNLISAKTYIAPMYASFFVALISLVATIFEFVQYSKLKKQYVKDMKQYNEQKELYKKTKADQEKIEKQNKNPELVKEYQQKEIIDFFKRSYDVINAVHNEYSPAKKRFKLFLEEYFPNEVLDNVKIVHRTKKVNYVPDFIIQFEKPKLNVSIEIEEPYTLSNVPENIQKDYEAKDRLRQRFSNELGWLVIVLSEEQAVITPTECCKYIEDSIESIFDEIKAGEQFANIKTIKKQKMLTGEERANLKKNKYRETYLINAGLMDNSPDYKLKEDKSKIEELVNKSKSSTKEEKRVEESVLKTEVPEINGKKNQGDKVLKTPEINKAMTDKKTPLEKKKEIENEQMQLIKRIAQKSKVNPIKTEEENIKITKEEKKVENQIDTKQEVEVQVEKVETKAEELKSTETPLIDDKKEIKEENVLKEESLIITSETKTDDENKDRTKEVRKEEDILNDLYKALDKHSKKQQEKSTEKEQPKPIVEKKLEKVKEEIKSVEKKETKIEKEVKSERKVKSAAEIILERKLQLKKQKELEEQNKKEEQEKPVIEKKEEQQETIKVDKKEEVVNTEKAEIKSEKEEKIEIHEIKSSDTVDLKSDKDIKNSEKTERLLIEAMGIIKGAIDEDLKLEKEKTPEKEKAIKEIKEKEPVTVEKTEEKKEEKEIITESKIEDSSVKKEVLANKKEEKEELVKKEVVAENVKADEEVDKKLIKAHREKIEGAVFDKHWDELIELCDAAINEVPYWDWAYYRRSTAWGAKREFTKVILDCNKAIGFNPNLADAYYNRGTARFFLGKFEDAVNDYQKSIDLNYIKKADAHFNKGLCYQKLKDTKQAYREFLKAKELGSQKAIDLLKSHYK